MALLWRPRRWDFRYLINFVNEPLENSDWKATLKLADLWQAPDLPADANTWEEALAELQKPVWKLPTIHGHAPDFQAACSLQGFLRKRLECLAKSKPHEANAEKGWIAKVYASGGLQFDDAADGLEFLADALRHELEKGAYQYGGRRGRRWTVAPLRLFVCECGCGQFFLSGTNGTRKRRKYLDDKHRMKFHNARNVEKKKRLARQRRGEGDARYF